MRSKVRVLACVGVVAAAAALATAAPSAPAGTRVSSKTLLGQLRVAAAHTSGYSRALFPLWVDADSDGCDTRKEVLLAEAVKRPRVSGSCRLRGGSWFSRYDGVTVTDSAKLDIDHLVPLAEAWRSGAWRWSTDTRRRFANDLGYGPDLIAVTASANRSKGDSEPAGYLPPRRSFDCRYEAWWVAVKWRWHLSVDRREKSWLAGHLKACGWPAVVRPGRPRIGTSSGSATGGVRLTAINFVASTLNGEWVRLRNVTTSRRTITGWTLRDAAGHVYTFPSFGLAAGAYVKVHTGSGSDTAADLYWGSGSPIWNNDGDAATLRNSGGTAVDNCSYTGAAAPKAAC
jgi:hypothetical protein